MARALLTAALLSLSGCSGTLDAGSDEPRGMLPVDGRNPVILCNDGAFDNWQGEFALLMASTGKLSLAGIIISDDWPWTDLEENLAGWEQMTTAARESGLKGVPSLISSTASWLVRPSDDDIDATEPNNSYGARFIVEESKRLATSYRPVVIVTGGSLTDVADAYLLDHSLPERVIVVSALGTVKTDGAAMGLPNGQLDLWADIIVARKFHYVQVSAYNYDPMADIPESLLPQLPTNAFTTWIRTKHPEIENAMDQVAIQVVGIPSIVTKVIHVRQSGEDDEGVPLLSESPTGTAELVTNVNSALGTAFLWQSLLDPATFAGE